MRFWYLICFVALLNDCRADFVLFGGQSQYEYGSDFPNYPYASSFQLGDSFSSIESIPNRPQGLINGIAINAFDGTAIFVGENDGSDNASVLIYRGSVVGSYLTPIGATGGKLGQLNCVAIGSDGTAILGGESDDGFPIIYWLPPGANEAILLSLPNNNQGVINCVAIGSNGTAILAGQDLTNGIPLIYSLPFGASTPTLVSLPNDDFGYINDVAIGPNGTAILGGQDTTTNTALILTLAANSTTAVAVSTPNSNDASLINGLAVGSDGNAILAGQIGSGTEYPLVYRLSSGSNLAELLSNANGDSGYLNDVAIGLDGIAIAGGANFETGLPLIYKIISGSSGIINIASENLGIGEIESVAIGSQNIAVFGGVTYANNAPLICTLSMMSDLPFPLNVIYEGTTGHVNSVEVYSCDGLYDIRRVRPYYYWQQAETEGFLNQ